MKSIRIWFSKAENMRFISHLDLNRCMTRAIQRSKLPIWRTEGFNPHLFINFSLPLSLGICGFRESMDIRLVNDVSNLEIKRELNLYLPKGINVINVTEGKMKPSEINYAEFLISLYCDTMCNEEILSNMEDFLNKNNIFVEKHTKSGPKLLDLKEYIVDYNIFIIDNTVKLKILLPAGNKLNINPVLLLDAFYKEKNINVSYIIFRSKLLNNNMEDFL